MLEGKSEKLEFQEMLSSPHWKIEMSKNKTKMLKKEPKEKHWKRELRELENQRKNDEKKTNKKTMKNDLSWNDPW